MNRERYAKLVRERTLKLGERAEEIDAAMFRALSKFSLEEAMSR